MWGRTRTDWNPQAQAGAYVNHLKPGVLLLPNLIVYIGVLEKPRPFLTELHTWPKSERLILGRWGSYGAVADLPLPHANLLQRV